MFGLRMALWKLGSLGRKHVLIDDNSRSQFDDLARNSRARQSTRSLVVHWSSQTSRYQPIKVVHMNKHNTRPTLDEQMFEQSSINLLKANENKGKKKTVLIKIPALSFKVPKCCSDDSPHWRWRILPLQNTILQQYAIDSACRNVFTAPFPATRTPCQSVDVSMPVTKSDMPWPSELVPKTKPQRQLIEIVVQFQCAPQEVMSSMP